MNLAAISAKHGRKTLVIDLDSQCNASQYLLGGTVDENLPHIAAFFQSFLSFRFKRLHPYDYLVYAKIPNLWIIPASPLLSELESRLSSKHKIYKLREALIQLGARFDDIYIDTPPAFNFYTLSALIASDTCLIPFDCDRFSRNALYTLMENVEEVRSDHNEALRVEGIIINQFLQRARLPKQLVDELNQEGLPMMKSMLSSSVKMRESHQACKPLVFMDPKHKLSVEYNALYDELQQLNFR